MEKLTQKAMMAAIRELGMTVSVRDGEIRVNHKGYSEATAYYTDDRQDAVDTARAMKAELERQAQNPQL